MEDLKSNEICQEPVARPFWWCYDDPVFELNDDGEIVDYVEHPEDFCLDSFHFGV